MFTPFYGFLRIAHEEPLIEHGGNTDSLRTDRMNRMARQGSGPQDGLVRFVQMRSAPAFAKPTARRASLRGDASAYAGRLRRDNPERRTGSARRAGPTSAERMSVSRFKSKRWRDLGMEQPMPDLEKA